MYFFNSSFSSIVAGAGAGAVAKMGIVVVVDAETETEVSGAHCCANAAMLEQSVVNGSENETNPDPGLVESLFTVVKEADAGEVPVVVVVVVVAVDCWGLTNLPYERFRPPCLPAVLSSSSSSSLFCSSFVHTYDGECVRPISSFSLPFTGFGLGLGLE